VFFVQRHNGEEASSLLRRKVEATATTAASAAANGDDDIHDLLVALFYKFSTRRGDFHLLLNVFLIF
jgi:hypothetical protein